MIKLFIPIAIALLTAGLFGKLFFGGGDDGSAVRQAVQAGAPIIDVRTAGEFSAGHFPDAVHIPYERIATEIQRVAPDNDQPVVLYCRTGSRSGIAKKSLESVGYTRVINGGGLTRMRRLLAE